MGYSATHIIVCYEEGLTHFDLYYIYIIHLEKADFLCYSKFVSVSFDLLRNLHDPN